jgi:hypothetical protein
VRSYCRNLAIKKIGSNFCELGQYKKILDVDEPFFISQIGKTPPPNFHCGDQKELEIFIFSCKLKKLAKL